MLSATGPAPFLAHQAAYDLSLKTSRRSPSIEAAEGRIVYNFSGSECEGYTSEFRQVSELSGSEGKNTLSDLRSTSWEDAEGKSYRFKIDTRMNEDSASGVDGIAERTGDHVTVKLKQPVAKTFTLDGSTVFPTEQVRRIIAAAREGAGRHCGHARPYQARTPYSAANPFRSFDGSNNCAEFPAAAFFTPQGCRHF